MKDIEKMLNVGGITGLGGQEEFSQNEKAWVTVNIDSGEMLDYSTGKHYILDATTKLRAKKVLNDYFASPVSSNEYRHAKMQNPNADMRQVLQIQLIKLLKNKSILTEANVKYNTVSPVDNKPAIKPATDLTIKPAEILPKPKLPNLPNDTALNDNDGGLMNKQVAGVSVKRIMIIGGIVLASVGAIMIVRKLLK